MRIRANPSPDSRPGIRRLTTKGGFRYLGPGNKKISDPAEQERIRSLAIPPAWENVWISTDSRSHLQATGRDAKGRKQYIYHQGWRRAREMAKFRKLSPFAGFLPVIRRRIRRDLAARGMSREKVLAAVVELLDRTLIRIGNEEYAVTNASYGLTTMRNSHAHTKGNLIEFAFPGKSRRRHVIRIQDPVLAKIVRTCRSLPGELFVYKDTSGNVHDITSHDVNDYIRAASTAEFSAKDFRTWHATVLAFSILEGLELPENETVCKRQLAGVSRDVANALGNTPAVCRKSYIHPGLFELYSNRLLQKYLKKLPGTRAVERRTRLILEAWEMRSK